MGAGIDYGLGQTNIDLENGIRYGVIPQGDVLQEWADSSEPDYGDDEEANEEDYMDLEPIGYALDDGAYKAYLSGDDGDIFITKSPYYTFARFCSPCAPGAGHLRCYDPEGVKTYCFAPDWFDSYDDSEVTGEYCGSKTSCPYPVYRVDSDLCVFMPFKPKDADHA